MGNPTTDAARARDELLPEERIRIHERIQEATGLVRQAEDDLPFGDPRKEELHDLVERVWEIGYEILADARYVPVEELAKVIAALDEEEPFLGAGDDGVTNIGPGEIEIVLDVRVSPRRVAERIHEALHARWRR